MEALQLQDIHLPENASIWPLALGWWILMIIIILVAIWLIIKVIQRTKQRKYRAKIFAKFDVLEKKLKAEPNNTNIAEINTLLRQLAITYYPRHKIASLTGADWLQFLDRSGNTQGFSRGAGRILIEAPYMLPHHDPNHLDNQIENLNIDEFIPLVRRWARKVVRAHS